MGMAGGMAVPALGGFASADFGDAEDMRPLGAYFDIGGHGSSTPYSSALAGIVAKHTEEIKGKTMAALNLPSGWKKRLRDFLAVKNGDLLDFLKVNITSHPTLGPAETLLRRFGNPNVSPTHPSVRDMVLDVSGADHVAEMNRVLDTFRGEGALKDYANQTRVIFDEYRMAGDEILSAQAALKAKLDRLDRIQGRITPLLEIEGNEKYGPLMEATEEYLKKVYEECSIETDYKALIQAYRRFAVLRDIVTMSRSLVAQENEPICSICLHEPVQYALSPCGHTFCQSCLRRQAPTCFMCRTTIKDRVKLYFG